MTPQLKNILAMAAFGTIAIFVRGVALPSMEIAFWRGAIALAVLWLIRTLLSKKKAARMSARQKGLLFLSGMAVGLNWALLFMAYEHTSVAVATLAYYFAPVLVIVLTPLLFRERMTLFQFFCFAMATLGLVLVIGTGSAGGSDNLRGILYGLGAASFYAGIVLMNKFVREGDGLERTMLQFAGAVALLFVLLLFRGGFQIGAASVPSIANLLIVGVFHTGLCYWLYFSSIKDLPGQQTAILSYVDPFVAILVSTLFFREPILPAQAVGAVLILGFTCLNQAAGGRWKRGPKERV
ncbi:DMT family transporter [Clostridium sp. D33t1_170424_F3]|uniref:DMT family transporter n=1 Tax=Clostridium sp. D33t1_170424_F3 TaxID=2787099 RepID=UPI0018A9DC4B|nr:DMT family transporter [Clostridium sp. D33t1_170424_F3]